MCEGTEQVPVRQYLGGPSSMEASKINRSENPEIRAKGTDFCPYLLELAAKNDLLGFKLAVENGQKIDEVGSWYGRKLGTKQMGLQQRTPAMIASLYGSVDVLGYILNTYNTFCGDINARSASDGSTALHCAVAGGAVCAFETVSLLLKFGADLNILNAQGARPADVIMVSPKFPHFKFGLQKILNGPLVIPGNLSIKVPKRHIVCGNLLSNYSEENGLSALGPCFESMNEFDVMVSESESKDHDPLAICFPLETSSSSSLSSSDAGNAFEDRVEKSRDFPVDPTLPDIKNSIYTTDEFRMFSFKVRPCSRAYSHDWTECPFVHPGENARRRDPRRYHYSCVPCPDFRKGACRRGDTCEYAHGVFESWLHPAQYRTRLCKDGTNCSRRVCFFAHTAEELRPLYVSTGSAVTSPRASSLDASLPSSPLGTTSQSSIAMGPSFFQSNHSKNTLPSSPMSPSYAGNPLGGIWQQSNMPMLHLPGAGLQSSRLRASLNAKDLSPEDLFQSTELEEQFNADLSALPSQTLCTQALLNAAIATSSNGSTLPRLGKYNGTGLTISPTNLEELFASEMVSSPRSLVQEPNIFSQNSTQFQVQKPTHLHSQLQAANSQLFHQLSSESHLQLQQAIAESEIQQQALFHSCPQSPSFAVNSPGRESFVASEFSQNNFIAARKPPSEMACFGLDSLKSPGWELDWKSRNGTAVSPAWVAARAAFAQRDRRSSSSRDLGARSALSDWGSPTGKAEWGVEKDDLCKLRKSVSFRSHPSDDPDFSWVHKLVKEGPYEEDSNLDVCSSVPSSNTHRDDMDTSVLSSWIEQMHLDQVAA